MVRYPFVSIVVAAYNAETTIKRCLEKLLSLDYPNFEIIVVDNNSTDRTRELILDYDVTYLGEKRKGWPAARNKGIWYSKAKFVANIDADCFASVDWLRNLVVAFDSENVACVVGKTLVEEGKSFAERYYASVNPFAIENKIGKTGLVPWGGGNNLMLRKAFVRAGGYDWRQFKSGADMEFHHRLEKDFGYKTKYEPKAIIFHKARGSIGEFFTVAAKYGHDGFLRSRCEEMNETKCYYNMFCLRQLYRMLLHLGGMGYNCFKGFMGHKNWLKVAANFFSLVSISGTLYGYGRARFRHLGTNLIRLSDKMRL